MTVPEEIAYLIFHHFRGELNDKERRKLQSWLAESVKHQIFFKKLENDDLTEDLAVWHRINTIDGKEDKEDRLFMKVLELTQSSEQRSKKKQIKLSWWYAAAAILICSCFGYFILQQTQLDKPAQMLTKKHPQDIPAGQSGARLVLPDGTAVDLRSNEQGIQVGEDIRYADGEKLMEKAISHPKMADHTFLTLEVPVKSFYKISLSDGTQVWLNAGSKLKYPLQFEPERRVVEFEGEAYFEVAKLTSKNTINNRQARVPFIVKSNGQLLEVLGTKFNIASYGSSTGSSTSIKTTLIEGKVALTDEQKSAKPIILTPGKQGSFDGRTFQVKGIDVEQVMAWKEGLFFFDGADAKDAFDQLAKWYDIDIKYSAREPKIPFYGTIERTRSLNNVVEILRKSGVNLRIDFQRGRTVLFIDGE